ncbi:hypothetical protein [Streptomyces sp. NPDC056194]|uniref:hypothetical protein n=1 Tax=Streptomyces sp. NPDC056194 TaxID=3345744 RepID=UPI0035DA3541
MAITPLPVAVQHKHAAGEPPAPIVALHKLVAALAPAIRHDERGKEDAFQATLTAAAVVTGSFYNTLDTAIGPTSWTGYPPADHHSLRYAACAVAYLGSADGMRGWWLHYTQRRDQLGDPRHFLTLIAPCACGTYLTADIANEDALIAMLDELKTPPGAPVACDHQLRIRATSYADQDHDSFEPPFYGQSAHRIRCTAAHRSAASSPSTLAQGGVRTELSGPGTALMEHDAALQLFHRWRCGRADGVARDPRRPPVTATTRTRQERIRVSAGIAQLAFR